MLDARFYYSGDDTYSAIWSDERGPVPQIFENTCGGKIDMAVHRGSWGNGTSMKMEPRPTSRALSTFWKTLPNQREASEAFVIGEEWGREG